MGLTTRSQLLDPKEDNKENDAEKDKHYDGITDSLWNCRVYLARQMYGFLNVVESR